MRDQVGSSPVMKRLANLVFVGAALIVSSYLLSDLLSSAYYNPLSNLGYLAFPLFIAAVFLFLYAYSWPLIRQAWTERRWKWVSWLAGAGFALCVVEEGLARALLGRWAALSSPPFPQTPAVAARRCCSLSSQRWWERRQLPLYSILC